MPIFLISNAFWGLALIRAKRSLEGGVYSDLDANGASLITGQCVFTARRLLEEK